MPSDTVTPSHELKLRFEPRTVLAQAQIQDLALSPDGCTIVYSRRVVCGNRYCTHLWLTDWA
ncbi:MAG: hypothetical protein KC432_04945, partial [Thermomicrobiales bacterium]|nr:hypothetical protein [Thermomicrobiales bacterium]